MKLPNIVVAIDYHAQGLYTPSREVRLIDVYHRIIEPETKDVQYALTHRRVRCSNLEPMSPPSYTYSIDTLVEGYHETHMFETEADMMEKLFILLL